MTIGQCGVILIIKKCRWQKKENEPTPPPPKKNQLLYPVIDKLTKLTWFLSLHPLPFFFVLFFFVNEGFYRVTCEEQVCLKWTLFHFPHIFQFFQTFNCFTFFYGWMRYVTMHGMKNKCVRNSYFVHHAFLKETVVRW